MILERWRDGSVSTVKLPIRARFKRYWKHESFITIRDVFQWNRLEFSCSHDSYFECLSKKFRDLPHSQEFVKINATYTYCSQAQKCAPFSLQVGFDDEIPACTNERDKICNEQSFLNMEAIYSKFCKKSCQVKQFTSRNTFLTMTAGTLSS